MLLILLGGNKVRRRFLIIALVIILAFTLGITGCNNEATPEKKAEGQWTTDEVLAQEPLMMRDKFLELVGATTEPIPYTYEEVVKFSGQSDAATAGAWMMAVMALEELYPDSTPVRGDIKIYAPGKESEGHMGVFGSIFSYITGAQSKIGFSGANFGEDFDRTNLMIYPAEHSGRMFFEIEWIFERLDTGKKVGVVYNLLLIEPKVTPQWEALGKKIVDGLATEEEIAEHTEYWQIRAPFVFENARTMPGLITVRVID